MSTKDPNSSFKLLAKIAALAITSFVLLLIFLLNSGWADGLAKATPGIGVAQLGQLGDAFAPLTCIFAMAAAIGAWASYGAQRDQIRIESKRAAASRLDELFFAGINSYKAVVNTLNKPERTAEKFFLDVRAACDYGSPFAQLALFQHYLAGSTLNETEARRLVGLVRGLMTAWRLHSDETDQTHVGALLLAQLSDDQEYFWACAIAGSDDEALINYGRLLGFDLNEEFVSMMAKSGCRVGAFDSISASAIKARKVLASQQENEQKGIN